MDITQFNEEYSALSPTEKAQFAETVRILLSEGLIWREDGTKRQVYTFLNRRGDLIAGYLSIAGWEVRHHEQCATFQVVHSEGYHRKRFSLDTTIWLLLLRMLYAEQQESMSARLTRYPIVTMGELIYRYTELPNARKRIKTNLLTALTQLQQLPIIRVATGGSLRIDSSEQVIELLPPLEVVIPAGNAASVAARLAEQLNVRPQDMEAADMGEEAEGTDGL